MTVVEKGPVNGVNVLRLPKAGLIVQVPIDSDPYQAYLAANARIEQERDALGEPTAEAYLALQAAVAGVNEFARTLLGGN